MKIESGVFFDLMDTKRHQLATLILMGADIRSMIRRYMYAVVASDIHNRIRDAIQMIFDTNHVLYAPYQYRELCAKVLPRLCVLDEFSNGARASILNNSLHTMGSKHPYQHSMIEYEFVGARTINNNVIRFSIAWKNTHWQLSEVFMITYDSSDLRELYHSY